MNDLIALPGTQKKREPANLPVEYANDARLRRSARARIGLAGAFIAISFAVAWYALAPTSGRPTPAQQSETAKPQEAPETVTNDVAGRQILALRTEVEALRAKLDQIEKRQQAEDVAPQLDSVTARNETPLGQKPRPMARPTEPPAEGTAERPTVTTGGQAPRTLIGYKIRDVYRGSALIETGRGMASVAVGDVLPGAGHVTAIKKQAGRWIVVTEIGEIAGDVHRQARAEPPRRRFAPAPYSPSLFYLPF